jgi:hypothetical protein
MMVESIREFARMGTIQVRWKSRQTSPGNCSGTVPDGVPQKYSKKPGSSRGNVACAGRDLPNRPILTDFLAHLVQEPLFIREQLLQHRLKLLGHIRPAGAVNALG